MVADDDEIDARQLAQLHPRRLPSLGSSEGDGGGALGEDRIGDDVAPAHLHEHRRVPDPSHCRLAAIRVQQCQIGSHTGEVDPRELRRRALIRLLPAATQLLCRRWSRRIVVAESAWGMVHTLSGVMRVRGFGPGNFSDPVQYGPMHGCA
jgi:hypothetical protein